MHITMCVSYVWLQTVVISAWDSHWSPKLFKVSGQMVWTEPPLADSPVISSLGDPKKDSRSEDSHMHGKIALVQRGAVPIVTKAMRVQVGVREMCALEITLYLILWLNDSVFAIVIEFVFTFAASWRDCGCDSRRRPVRGV
jgi:hypothetical protein